MNTPDAPDAIDEIYDLMEVYFSHDNALVKAWLNTSIKSLPAGMTPNQMLKARRILELLAYVRELISAPAVEKACSS